MQATIDTMFADEDRKVNKVGRGWSKVNNGEEGGMGVVKINKGGELGRGGCSKVNKSGEVQAGWGWCKVNKGGEVGRRGEVPC